MDDALKDFGMAVLGLALFSAFASERVRQAAKHDLQAAVPGSRLYVRIEPRGIFGMATGQAWRARVSGGHFATDHLPFHLEPGGGILATVRHLELDLHDVTLRDLHVETLRADIPFVKADGPRALFGGHLTLRGAQDGVGAAVLSAEGIRSFLAKRRPQFQEVRIELTPGEAIVSARAPFLGAMIQLEARGGVEIVDGRFLNAAPNVVMMNGKPLEREAGAALIRSLNPIIDVDRDLGLGDWLYVTGAEIGDGILTVRGRVTIPSSAARKKGSQH